MNYWNDYSCRELKLIKKKKLSPEGQVRAIEATDTHSRYYMIIVRG